MYFDRNIDLSEKIRMVKKSEGNYSSYALNEEIYFTRPISLQLRMKNGNVTANTSKCLLVQDSSNCNSALKKWEAFQLL